MRQTSIRAGLRVFLLFSVVGKPAAWASSYEPFDLYTDKISDIETEAEFMTNLVARAHKVEKKTQEAGQRGVYYKAEYRKDSKDYVITRKGGDSNLILTVIGLVDNGGVFVANNLELTKRGENTVRTTARMQGDVVTLGKPDGTLGYFTAGGQKNLTKLMNTISGKAGDVKSAAPSQHAHRRW